MNGQQGDDVGVDDRADPRVTERNRRLRIFGERTSSLTRSNMTMFASAATPIVRTRPALCPAASWRDRNHLDEREQVGTVDDQRCCRDNAEAVKTIRKMIRRSRPAGAKGLDRAAAEGRRPGCCSRLGSIGGAARRLTGSAGSAPGRP